MFVWDHTYRVEQQRRIDEAEQARLARLDRQLAGSSLNRVKVHQRLLIWLGGVLVVWGCRLQSRYEVLVTSSLAPGMTQAIIAGDAQSNSTEPAPCTS
ncbi:MAG: hypothetical protein GX495_15105 [Chloroflexi bacterium]|jgi:hypothetical protein|nr:hypothetical protein [Chloroflexota bacterium]